MNQADHDDDVARALDDLEVPEHGEGFFDELEARLAEPPVETVAPGAATSRPAAATAARDAMAVPPDGAAPADATAKGTAAPPLHGRRRIVVAALAAALAVAAGIAAFFLTTGSGPTPSPSGTRPALVASIRPLFTRHNLSWLFADGGRLVWMTHSAGKTHLQAESLDLDTGTRTSLKKLAPHLTARGTGALAVSGDRVAWIDQSGRTAKLYTGTLPEASPSPIGSPTRNFSSRGVLMPGKKALRLSSRFAVWVDTQGGKNALWAYDFTRKKELTIPGSAGVGDQFALGGSLVAWIVTANGSSMIRSYDLGAESSFVVPLPAGVAARDLAISGTTIVWSDNRNATSAAGDDNNDIYGYDVDTGKDFPICHAPGMQVKPAIDGDLVAWLDARPLADGAAAAANAVYGYLLTLGKEFAISTGQSVDGTVSVTGDRVIWTSHANGQATIFGATVTHTGDQIEVAPIKP